MLGMETRARAGLEVASKSIHALGTHPNGKRLLGSTQGSDDVVYDDEEGPARQWSWSMEAMEKDTSNRMERRKVRTK